MKNLLYVLIFLCVNSSAQSPYILIKYSKNDCAFCNAQLFSFADIPNATVVVASKQQYQTDEDIARIIDDFTGKPIRFTFSDSLYYLHDSTERSVCYVISGSKVLYHEYLKNSSKQDVLSILSRNATDSNSIICPEYRFIRQSKNHLYIANNKKYILKISKQHLGNVEDTLLINTPDMKKELFKVTYGNQYLAALDSFSAQSKRFHVQDLFSIVDFQASEDSLWAMVMTDVIYKNDDDIHVRNIAYILHYYRHTLVKILQIDTSPLKSDPQSDYRLISNHFTNYNGIFYVSVFKSQLSTSNYIYAKCKQQGNKLVIDTLLPICLPDHLVTSAIGYQMTTGKISNGIINNEYDNDFFDLSANKLYALPLAHVQNSFTKDMVNTAHFNVGFMIYSFSFYGNKLSVIYKSTDSLINATFNHARDNWSLISSHLLSHPFPDDDKFPGGGIISDENGIYCFIRKQKKFNFYPYN